MTYNPKGQLHAIEREGLADVRFRYDVSGRVAERIDPAYRFEGWTYYPNGRIRTHRYKGVNEKRWTEDRYDPDGLLLARYTSDRSPQIHHYDPLGRRTRTDFPDGTWSEFTYDARSRLIRVTGTHQADVTYTYDAYGRRQVAATTPNDAPHTTGGEP